MITNAGNEEKTDSHPKCPATKIEMAIGDENAAAQKLLTG